MIPKKIHYCWFGRNPLPESALKCIASWRKFFPDYEIIEWNEDNFDVISIPYTAQAYEVKKYAFVSDYARFKILYEQGGLYFDTDVEVIRPMDDIIVRGPFMGFEVNPNPQRPYGAVGAGLGIAAEKGMTLYKSILPFDDATGRLNKTDNTRTIHWFSKTWLNVSPWRQHISRFIHRIFGVNTFSKLRRIIKK